MARKSCPQCKLVTGLSAATCSRCGHGFEAVAAAPPTARPKRCAMCGTVNHRSVERCQCGFEFDQDPAELRNFFVSRRHNAWALMIGSIVIGVGGVGVVSAMLAFSPVIPVKLVVVVLGGCLAAATGGCRRAMRILRAVGDNLDELDGKTSALPAARIVADNSHST